MVIGEKQKERRRYIALLKIKHESDSVLSLFHNDRAHKRLLNYPGAEITDFLKQEKAIFDEYPDITPKTIFERYEKDEENGINRIKWDVIPAEQYHNLLTRYMEMGEFARIPGDVVTGWFKKIKRNTIILYYLSYIFHRKYGFPFEVVPIKTDNVIEAQMWIYINTNFYDWATFSNGREAFTDRAFEQLFPLIKTYNENMSPEEILILINRIIQVSHPTQKERDFTECFIEGGRKSCDKITNG